MDKRNPKILNVTLIKRLFKYIKPYKLIFIGVFTSVILLSIFTSLRPVLLQQAIDTNIVTKTLEGFLPYILVMISLLVLEVICQLLFIYYAGWLGQNVVKDIRVQLFKRMLEFKMKYFNTSSVGVLVTRAVTDMERISDIFGQGLFMIFRDLLTMFVVSIVMLFINWKLSIMVFAMLPLLLYATKIFQRYMKRAFEEVRTEVSNLNSFVQERVTGMQIVQLFTRELTEYKNFQKINNRHKKAWLKTVWYNSIFFPIAELAQSITIGLIVWYGGLQAVATGVTTLGDITAFVMMIPMLFRPLRQIADKFNTLQMGMIAAERVFKVFDTNAFITNAGTQKAEAFKGAISFKKVWFSYVTGEPVLKNISFQVEAGQTVAIVGATGAGKSTIVNLLSRFYEIDKGTICIDSVPITQYTLVSLRKQIAVVLQDVFLFANSIMNNITLSYTSIAEEQVYKAAKEIGIHDFIMQLPNGYNYNVKERGVMLSSGQRQLISFLRAYVTNPSILVLDEATSSIDSHSEELIQNALEKITQNRTSIIIAHRLDTIKKADKILVLEAGEVVEEGTHEELLKLPNGYYKNLYEVQFATANNA